MMNVMGYEEALAAAQEVEVGPGFVVPVASLSGLALLKLFAWVDRGEEDPKDALDLMSLFWTYADAGNQSRLYEEAIPLLESVDFDLALASPRLLARDVRRIATPHTLRQAQSLLADPEKADRLIIHMAKGLHGTEDEIGTAQQLLDQFIVGLTED